MDKNDKPVIVITGGSRGIGAATALLAAANGYNVVVNYRHNKDAARTVVSKIRDGGGSAVAVRADISSEDDVVRLFGEADRLPGRLTALVNNAGILEHQMPLSEMTAERLHRVFAANITGQLLCAREAIRRMSARNGGNGGAIVNVSSIASRTGSPGEYVDYAASKGAIDTFTVGLAREVAAEGIRVNAVRPGFIYTDIHADGGEPDRVDKVAACIPLGRGGTPEEVAEAILWLLSERASFCTGTFIDLAGGK